MIDNYYKEWKPQEDICLILDDKTAEDRSVEDINNLFKELRAAANKHGFDLYSWGSRNSFAKMFKLAKGAG